MKSKSSLSESTVSRKEDWTSWSTTPMQACRRYLKAWGRSFGKWTLHVGLCQQCRTSGGTTSAQCTLPG
uniref:Uncharacterized protein n=1 Tax=Anguilla anguilla TaxID=7936 RepID=A0A0E9RD56_ANGAN